MTPLDVAGLAIICVIGADLDELRQCPNLEPAMERHWRQLELWHLKFLREFGMTPLARVEMARQR